MLALPFTDIESPEQSGLFFVALSMKTIQPIIIAALAIAIVLLINRSCELSSQLSDSHEKMTLNDSLLQEKISVIKDSAGREITRLELQTITTQQFATSKAQEAAAVRDQLERANAKIENLHAALSVASTTTDTVFITQIDSLKTGLDTLRANWKDKWLSMSITSYFNNYNRTGLSVGYELKNDLTASWYWKRRKLEMSITQANPNTITGRVQTYTISYQPAWYEKWYITGPIGFGVGFVAGVALSGK